MKADRVPAILLLILSAVTAEDGPVVRTHLGDVLGQHMTSRSGRQFMAFPGIPYAKPPLGRLRFQAPEPLEPWCGVWDGTKSNQACVQHFGSIHSAVIGDENCLFLDVYTADVSRKAPVLVHFHGGDFIAGTKGLLRPTYLMDEDVVVVSVNYRLGIFGFLTFETKDLAGNQGLKDQVMALRWVKENIASFGGDPDKVTIHGESAGAASVYHHIVSPLSRGLFHRAITSSGASYNTWAVSPPGVARRNARKLMSLIGCPQDPPEAIPCLMEKETKDIVSQFYNFIEFQTREPLVTFHPTLEEPGPGAFLVPKVSHWDHSPVPLLSILSSAEGLLKTKLLKSEDGSLQELSEKFREVAPISLGYYASSSHPDDVTRKVWDFYFPNKNQITEDDFTNITMMYTDAWFSYGIMKGANLHKGDVYFWYFDYIVNGTQAEKYNIGAPHCGDEVLLWEPISFKPLVEPYVEVSKKYVQMAVGFMETGVPNVPGTEEVWPKWTFQTQNYVQLDKKGFSIKKGLLQERFSFWESLGSQDIFH